MRGAADNDQPVVQRNRAAPAGLDVVAQRERDAFEHRAIQVRARMRETQPDECAAGLRIPHRAALAHQIRQEQHAVGAGRHAFGRRLEQHVRIAVRQQARRIDFRLAELVAEPRNRRAGRDRAAEHVQVALPVEHVRHADEPVPRIDMPAYVAPAHAGADHRDMLPGTRRAGREGRDGRVDTARDDGRAGRQAELLRPLRQQPADDLRRIDEPLGHHRRRNAEHVERVVGPLAARDVVHAADVAGRTVIDRHFAGQQVDHVRVRRQEIAHVRPHVRPLAAQPQHLRETVVAVDAIARDHAQPLDVHVFVDPVDFRGRAPVHPDQARMQRPHVDVDRNARAAVQAAHAHRADRSGRHALRTRVAHAPRDALEHRVEPDLRPLLGPQRARRIGLVAGRVPRDDRAMPVDQQRLGALRADVDANHVFHDVSGNAHAGRISGPASAAP